jgi:flagellar basal-body rod modification protein FlgD
MIPPTAKVASSTDTAAYAEQRMPMQKLGQDEFIKILVTQLRSQDPLNPMKDTEFVGQMAQFNALESTKAMQTEIQSLRANSLIGYTVEVQGEEENVIGEVTSVDFIQGELKLIIDGQPYSMADVIRVQRSTANGSKETAPLTKTPSAPV